MPELILSSVRCADITPTPISWLWEPYLARGKLAILDGDPGTGKSFITIDLAARISTGTALPGRESPSPRAAVLLLNAEDDAGDTIRPRVSAAGGDPELVRVLAAPGLGLDHFPQFPDDVVALERAILETGAALVVVDPMMAFFPPRVSTVSDQSVRRALTPLAELAAATSACILFVRHLRKSGGPTAIYRGSGSIGIIGAVRTSLMVGRHPDEPELRVLSTAKTNIGPPGPSLGFRLVRIESTGQTRVEWTGPLDISADDLFGSGTPLRAGARSRERAVEWLRAFLASGKQRAVEVQEAASRTGIPLRTLERAKLVLRVKSEAVNKDGKMEWWWRDPAAAMPRNTELWLDSVTELESPSELDFDPEAQEDAIRAVERLKRNFR